MLWFEHDVTDQLSLIHLLGHYATHRRPSRLELVSISDFPGVAQVVVDKEARLQLSMAATDGGESEECFVGAAAC